MNNKSKAAAGTKKSAKTIKKKGLVAKKSLLSTKKKTEKKKKVIKTSPTAQRVNSSKEKSSDKYLKIIDNVQECYFEIDLRGNFTFMNDAGCRTLGYTKKKLIGADSRLFVEKDDEEKIRKAYRRVKKTGKPYEGLNWHVKRKDGTKRYLEGSISLLKNPAGKPAGYFVIANDFTERYAAEEKIRKSESIFRVLFDQSSHLMGLMKPDGTLLQINKTARNFAGIKEELILGKLFWTTPWWSHSPDEQERLKKAIKQAANGEFIRFQTTHFDGVGNLHHVDFSLSPVKDENGNVILLIPEGSDITERVQAERLLVDRDERLRGITTSLPGVIFQFYAKDTGEYGINYVSEPVDEFSKIMTDEEMTNLDITFPSFLSRIHEEDREKFLTSIDAAVKKSTPWSFEGRVVKKGKTIWFQGLSSPIRLENQTIFNGMLLNITERKLAEEKWRKSEEKFRKIFMTEPDCIGITRLKDGLILDGNQGFEDIIGWKVEEVKGTKSTEPPMNFWVDLSERDFMVAQIRAGRDVVHREFKFRRKDGAIRNGIYSTRPINVDDEECLIFILQDITDRILAEEKFRKIFMTSPNLIGITRMTDGVLIDINQGAKDLVGWDRELAIGKNITQPPFSFWVDMSARQYMVSELRAGRDVLHHEFEFRHHDGSIHTGIYSARPINISGEDCLVFIMQDISERKKAEEELKQSRENYKKLFEDHSAVKVTIDPGTGQILDANRAAVEYYGWTHEDMVQKKIWEINTLSSEAMMQRMENIRQNKKMHFETIHRLADGSLRDVEVFSSRIEFMGKEVIHSIIHDVTDRKRFEKDLRKSEVMFRNLFKNSPVAALMLADRKITRVNPALCEMMGFSPEELIGQSVIIGYPNEEEYERVGRIVYNQAREKGIGVSDARLKKKNGEEFDVMLYVCQVDPDDISEGYQIILIDVTERKHVEQALRESEEKYRLLADQSIMGMYIVQDGYFKYANYATSLITGYSIEEMLSWKKDEYAKVLHPDDRAYVAEQVQIKQTGDPDVVANYTWRIITKSGETKWLESFSKTITFGGSPADFVMGIDVTERKKAEEKLREEEQRFRTLAEQSSDMILLIDRQGTILYENPAVDKILGLNPEERIGKNVFENLHQDDVNVVIRNFKILLSDKNSPPLRDEIRIRNAAGIWHTFEAVGVSLAHGDVVQTLMINLRDITERRKVEQSLRESEEKFRILTESSPTAIMVYQNDKWVYANPASIEITGYTSRELLGMNFWDIVHPDDRPMIQERGQKRQRGEAVANRYSFRIISKDGTVKWVDLSGAAIVVGGSPAGLISVMDITERKRVEDDLKKSEYFLTRSQHVGRIGSYILEIASMRPKEQKWHSTTTMDEIFGIDDNFVRTGANWLKMIVQHDEVNNYFREQVFEKHGRFDKEYQIIRYNDGEMRWIHGLGELELDNRGNPVRMIGTVQDITDLKKSEEELKNTTKQFKDIIEFFPDAVMVSDKDEKIIAWNRAMEELTGISKTKMIGQDHHQISVPFYGEPRKFLIDLIEIDDKELEEKYSGVKRFGNVIQAETFTPALFNNRGAHVFARASSLLDDNGNIVGAIEAIRDITESKIAIEKLRKEEERFRILTEQSSDIIVLIDKEGKIIYENPAVENILGIKFQDRVQQSAFANIHPDDVNIFVSQFKLIMRGEEKTISKPEVRIRHIDGSWRTFEVVGNVMRKGNIIEMMIVNLRDITERKLAEEKLRMQEQRFRTLAEQSSDIIVLINKEGTILYENPAIERILGYNREARVGSSTFENVHPDDIKNIMEIFTKLISDKDAPLQYTEIRVRHVNGNYRYFDLVAKSLVHDDIIESVLVNLRDITERKMAEEEIMLLNESLEQRVRERTAELEAFSYSVSHDLRAPLRTIHGFGQALLEDYFDKLDEQAKGYLGRIRRATETMSDLIEDMLKLSRISRTEMDIVKVNLSSMVKSIADDLRKSQPDRLVDFIIAENLESSADPRLMRIVFENLLLNAWKFTGKNDKTIIEFGLTTKEDKKVYFIRDNGAGFDMEYAGKLFAPFQRLHNVEEFSGTGIGLAIVKRIITRHGGSIWAEAKVGEGATIYFTLE